MQVRTTGDQHSMPGYTLGSSTFERERLRDQADDARATSLPSGSFDLVHARLLLINVPWPDEVVAEMTRLTRPGGWVTGEEADAIMVCYPRSEASDRLCALLLRAWRLADADISIGRRLEVRAHIEDPRTVLAPMLYVTAWGRKPD